MEPLMSDDRRGALERVNIANDVLNAALLSCYAELSFVAKRVQVHPVPLKGLSTAALYSEYAGRPMRDIDVLVDRRDALTLRTVALTLGFTEASPVSSTDITNDYELPRLSKAVSIEANGNLGVCLEEAGIAFSHNRPSTFLLTAPLEIHYDLEINGRLPVQLQSDEPRLSPTSELFYLMYKLYVDAVILNKLKAIKLLGDIIRLLNRRASLIDWTLFFEWTVATKSIGLVTNILWHLVHTFGMGAVASELDQSRRLHADFGDLYFGDLVGRLVTTRSPRYLALRHTGNESVGRDHV